MLLLYKNQFLIYFTVFIFNFEKILGLIICQSPSIGEY